MKANVLKFLHYAAFVAFFVVAALKFFVPVGINVVIAALAGVFIFHTFVHGQAVAAEVHGQYDEFWLAAAALRAKFVSALHTFITSVDVNPALAAVSSEIGSVGNAALKDLDALKDKFIRNEPAAPSTPEPAQAAPAPAPEPVSAATPTDPAPAAPAAPAPEPTA
jgi:hypothetical protein